MYDGWARYMQPYMSYYSGDTFNLMRPDYSVSDNTPVLVAANQKYRLDPIGRKLSEPFFPDAEYYDIVGNQYIIEPGDILVKSSPDGMAVPVTLLTFGPIKSLVAVRTGRIGKITNEVDGTPVYTNVYYDFLREGFPGSAINRNLQESLRIPQTRIVIYQRLNITRLRMHLVETDLNYYVTQPSGEITLYERRWLIEEIDRGGNQMVLTVRNV